MQTYGRVFAHIYNLRWSGFARQVAPALLAIYARTPAGQARQPILDLCCGTGQLALAFLEDGYQVTGLDLSEHMLRHAAENAADHVAAGQARFVMGDAVRFALGQGFGLVVSTYDALNHLDSLEALRGCFDSVAAALLPGGLFVFDLNTRAGLLTRWNSMSAQEGEDSVIIQRGIYDGYGRRAYMKISGFLRTENGLYERFDETLVNTVFEVDAVLAALRSAGWPNAYAARLEDLKTPLVDPEKEGRVFFVAQQPG